ncbi:cell surface receptor IPT TIG domain containing protein [Fusarium agapanthi]|uniref:Cell surface receptor IPT TIG domain containing protein n=1 Tax=Fusarium agapanthi TaxID=1803897 RepID=A0A9P5AY59_9HYPO|nr:cell surface receptor IPT TIG domain containing protein [Fusarium agapanthi]
MALQESGIGDVTKSWLGSKDPARICLHGALYDVHWDHDNKPATVPADVFSKTLRSNELPAGSVGTTPIDALITFCSFRSDKEQNDGVEGQREAKDISYNWSFNRSKGGIHYFIAGEEEQGQPTKPEPGSIDALRTLNEHQSLLDACRKGAEQYPWDMFSLWWKYVTDVTNKTDDYVNHQYQAKVKTISDRLGELNMRVDILDAKITVMKEEGQAEGGPLQGVKNGTDPFFYRARDPTVLLGGVDSGWPIDFNDSVNVRIPPQTVSPSTTIPSNLSDLVALIASKFPGQKTLKNAAGDLPVGQVYPQFHDKLSPTSDNSLWRDRWEDLQPWFPLYAEWEIEYTHVPFQFWQLDQQASRVSDSKKTRYGVPADDGTPLWEKMKLGKPQPIDEARILSGRVLILPQPSFSLNAKVRQLFADTPPQILKESIPPEKQTRLTDNINQLSFLSAPLAGLTEGLLTLSQGTHIKPDNKFVKDGQQLSSAIAAATYPSAGFSAETIAKIQNNSALTPYASVSDFSVTDFFPFKPATHGQFTKFNVIDKFGQALVAIDPKPRVGGPEPLYPCISDYYEPQPVTLKDETKVANTVMKNSGLKLGEPTWGWVVLNYADQGIQLFLPNGAFYREIRFGGPGGVITEPKWLPFKRDDALPPVENVAQLDALISRMGDDPDYARGFWDMLSMAVDNMAPAPSAPTPSFYPRSTKEPLMHLVSKNDNEKNAYDFQLKLGDFFREYDGLVGSEATNLTAISKANYPKFNPFWIEQFHDSKPVEPEAYADKRTKELQIFGAIFDPFTPINGYSSILPPRSLQLPSWTWQDAMQNMTAFFHAGPLTLTQDVGDYDSNNPLTTKTVKKRPSRNAALPALDEGEWSWLQSFVEQPFVEQPFVEQPFVDEKGGSGLPLYNAYGIEMKGNPLTPGFEKGPYTAVKGFLQLRQPLLKDKPDKPA